MNDLSVAIGVGKKLDTSQHVVVDFDGAQTVNYSEQEGQSASYTSPTYTVTFYKDNEIYSSQTVKFGETAVVPEIPLYYRLMGYFAWSPDLTGKKIYQDVTSTLVKKTDTLVISLYDNDHAQDVSDIAAIIQKFNTPIQNTIDTEDLTIDQKLMLEDLKTKHVTYNVDSSTALKEFKANVLSYYNDYPDFIPSLVIFHISTDKILQFEHSSSESWWSTDPITGERDKNKSTYRIKQWQINADSFKLALYSGIYCQLYGSGYCYKDIRSEGRRYTGKRMFVIANAPYSYFFAPGFDTLGNVVGHHSWWVCYMPWKNMGMTMQSMNTSENFISNLKKALCDPSGKFYGTYPSYSQVCSYMKSIGQTGATSFPDNYPFFT